MNSLQSGNGGKFTSLLVAAQLDGCNESLYSYLVCFLLIIASVSIWVCTLALCSTSICWDLQMQLVPYPSCRVIPSNEALLLSHDSKWA